MNSETPPIEADRRLPLGDEIFLDHVGHFVRDRDTATAALARAGFAPTPVSIQVTPDPAGGEAQPTGTGNVTVMLDRGYLEILFKTADTPLGRDFDAMMARYGGVRLAAFAVTDAAATQVRLARAGFRMQPLVAMQRPVRTAAGDDIAAFSIARPMPGEMPEGRIQVLRHRTEPTVWQPRWLKHPNGAAGLIDVVIAEADPEEAAARFSRFLDREVRRNRFGRVICLDRGRVQLVAATALPRLFPAAAIPDLPFIAGYGLAVASLAVTAACLRAGGLAFEQRDACVIAPFPPELGVGSWIFVERAADLPWREDPVQRAPSIP
jgi:glyoxalase-like protein